MKYRGRPAKYERPEDMQKLIVEYFNECDKEGKKPTVTGLGYVLGLDRKTLLRYEDSIALELNQSKDNCIKIRRKVIERLADYIL